MRSFLRLLSSMTRAERIALAACTGAFFLSLFLLLHRFYKDVTVEVPTVGGTYIEGSVGEVRSLIPWFTVTNDVNRDIESLVFAGLMKYDPFTKKIVEDLATLSVTDDNRIYTLTLKKNLFWHDSTPEHPHPVTADDVVFTYQTIQDPAFQNPLLKQNFRGVDIEKLDERTVRFRLKIPYTFFVSNLTLALIPKASFEGIPVGQFDQALDFGFQPVGAGPYKLVSLIETDLSTEVTLQRFERKDFDDPKFERVVFRVFSDYSGLLSDLSNLDAVRQVPRNEKGVPVLPRGFKAIPYTLPQYVALFFNLNHSIVQDTALRLGLQLATNKQEIADELHETHIVDTPLLELDLGEWKYKFDPQAAQGALFESEWNVPEKVRLQRLLEQRDANAKGPLQFADHVVLLETGAILTLTGSTKGVLFPAFVNGVRVQTGVTLGGVKAESGTWIVRLGTDKHQSGSLSIGFNIVRMADSKGKVLDTAYIERLTDDQNFRLARNEQQMVDQFLNSKKESTPVEKRITTQDLFLEHGYLRRRVPEDPEHVRINNKGQPLKLTLLTSPSPASYPVVANLVKEQWHSIGVEVNVDIPKTRKEFEDKMLKRQYDVLLFGESLLDNLDSYPYWHSSQMQDTSGDPHQLKLDAFNLSQYASFDADALLLKIRQSSDGTGRTKALTDLNEIIKRDIPAIFLYSPLSIFGYRDDVGGVDIGTPSVHSDRLLTINRWYVQTDRQFKEGKSWWSFFGWLWSIL